MTGSSDPRLTRRDALKAGGVGLLAGTGLTTIGSTLGDAPEAVSKDAENQDMTEMELKVLHAVAEVVYPPDVDVEIDFIGSYVGQLNARRTEQMQAAIAGLQSRSQSAYGERFENLPIVAQESLLRWMGVDRVYPNPRGTLATRVRYHIVNGLLFALFTNPLGAGLFGIDNPLGYPGGYYRGQDNE